MANGYNDYNVKKKYHQFLFYIFFSSVFHAVVAKYTPLTKIEYSQWIFTNHTLFKHYRWHDRSNFVRTITESFRRAHFISFRYEWKTRFHVYISTVKHWNIGSMYVLSMESLNIFNVIFFFLLVCLFKRIFR